MPPASWTAPLAAAQAAHRAVAEQDIAAMRAGDVAGNRKRPRPVPPSSWLRALSSRRNGLNTSSRILSGNAWKPSSSMVTVR